jgi:hypothetical protein
MKMDSTGDRSDNQQSFPLRALQALPPMATAGSMSGLRIHLGLAQVKARAKQTRGRMPK